MSDRTAADLERVFAMLALICDRLRASEGEDLRIYYNPVFTHDLRIAFAAALSIKVGVIIIIGTSPATAQTNSRTADSKTPEAGEKGFGRPWRLSPRNEFSCSPMSPSSQHQHSAHHFLEWRRATVTSWQVRPDSVRLDLTCLQAKACKLVDAAQAR